MNTGTRGLAVVLALALGAALYAEEGGKPKTEEVKKDPKDMNADEAEAAGLCPVCKNEHKLVYHFTVNEKTYHFATRKCQKDFGADPAKYGVKNAPKPEEKKPAPKPAPEEEPEEKEEGS